MTDTVLQQIDAYIEANMERTIDEIARLCAIPSVSAQGTGIDACAQLVSEMLTARGLTSEVIPTAGNPVVLARGDSAPGSPRLLFYNHYDVQPAEPLELWHSPAFELARRGDQLFARGVADDKGEFVSRVAALDAVRAVTGGLPCGVTFIVEGEEEVSSPNLPGFIAQHAERLQADACLWEFGMVNFQGAPVQYLGLRGICYVELSVTTACLDAHSGLAGSIFPNAAWRLTWALSTIKGPDERVRIPGFYDNIVPPSARDLELLAALPDEAAHYRETYGVKGFLKGMADGPEFRREEIFSPTCTICGLTSGYQGPGSKTVLPAQARAKMDFRLIPDQDPQDIVAKLRAHLDAEGFGDVEVTYLGGGRPARTDPDDPFIRMVIDKAAEVYEQPTQIWPMVGGSGPNYPFTHHLKTPIATVGSGYPGAQAHAPNENIRISDLRRTIKHLARIVLGMGDGSLGH